MGTKKELLFVINPISGGRNKGGFEKTVGEVLDKDTYKPTFVYTKRQGHAYELASEFVKGQKADAIIAVGGDGTINEVASALYNTDIPLGIIPEGSGNGLALYLGIPLNEKAAIRRLNKFDIMRIDSGVINDVPFFNMAGLGFDASVSDRFAHESIRGPLGYMKAVLTEISSYKAKKYELTIDDKKYEREAFMISVANSPQYGNNAYIAPNASVTDGVLDVCIIHKFPIYTLPLMIYHLFAKTADQSEYVEIIPGKRITIKRDSNDPVHVDGEPKEKMGTEIRITVNPSGLSVIC